MNKINIEITPNSYKIDVTINNKTYTETSDNPISFKLERAIADDLYYALNKHFIYDCQNALCNIKYEKEK